MLPANSSPLPAGLPLEQQVVRLHALLEASRQVHSTIRTQEVLRQTARILVRELEAEGALFLAPDGETTILGVGEMPPPPYLRCPRFSLCGRDHRQLLTLVISPASGTEFSVYEQDFAEGLALQAAVAVENATLHERDVEWARVQQDLHAARQVQRSLLPQSMPEIPGFSIAARSTPCFEVGGDYLDTIPLSDGAQLMVVADVAGKGLASAIVATGFRAALRSLACHNLPIEEMAGQLGGQHWGEGEEARRRYVTACLLRLRPDEAAIEVLNAGHNPAILTLPDGMVQMIEASGPPLGLLPGVQYAATRFDFPAGSRILLYTDGLTEVFCGEEEFGCERLVSAFRDHPAPEAGAILNSLWQALGTFSRNAAQSDDMTALAICHLHPNPQESVRP